MIRERVGSPKGILRSLFRPSAICFNEGFSWNVAKSTKFSAFPVRSISVVFEAEEMED